MASDVVIRAEGLGKKYVIGHKSNEQYTALRDVVARSARGIVRTAVDILRGRPIYSGDELEEFWALRNVSFEIKRGDVVGIVGGNGAGKSTLLKILSRITEPSDGRVEIRGRVASLLEVGTGFHPELTGRENIYLNGAILGMNRAEIRRKFDEIVEFSGVEKFLDTPVKRYSSGMYVRLAFAVAAHLEPEILVVDEVLAVGDAEFQKKCLGKMQSVAGQGRTVLFVSHNIAAVRRLCTTGMVLDAGKAVAMGSIDTAIAAYVRRLPQRISAKLTERSDRRGTGEARIDGIDFGSGYSAVAVGEEVCVRLFVAGGGADGQFRPWLLFRNAQGDEVLMVMPTEEGAVTLNGLATLECRFVNPLCPGTYSIACGLLARGGNVVDWVDDALALEVTPTFMSGQPYDGRLGAVTLTGRWDARQQVEAL